MSALIGMTEAELERLCEALGESPYRGRQVARWMYQRVAASFDEMTDLPKPLRARLGESHTVRAGEVMVRKRAADGTVKLGICFPPESVVECVLIPARRRATVCVSTQVGCPVGCQFCATGQGGFERNLRWQEIVEQILACAAVWRQTVSAPGDLRQAPLNVVYMGMGEPMLNYRNTVRSIRFVREHVGLGSRSITVSTLGFPDRIRQFAQDEPQVNLAISLAAPSDELRARLAPGLRGKARRVEELMSAARDYVRATNRRISFEYVLLRDVNSRLRHAHRLADLLRDFAEGLSPGAVHVNLIPYNETGGPFERPSVQELETFRRALQRRGVHATVRAPRGDDVCGACGQLRGWATQAAPRG
ncbi:MAG: 23S rRNA (adenine(2503)-C(2))-methyltransferase RlmN [Armatimonadota bacterium]